MTLAPGIIYTYTFMTLVCIAVLMSFSINLQL